MITPQTRITDRTHPTPIRHTPLKCQRLLRGWSQQDVVDELYKLCAANGRPDVGLTVDTLGHWENGCNTPSPVYRKHLCTLYGLTADKLGFIAPHEMQA